MGSSDTGVPGSLVVLAALGGLAWWGYEALLEAQVEGRWLLWRDCPFGTELAGKHPPDGTSEWCQEKTDSGSYRPHGPAADWYPSGQIKAKGSYVHGKKEGVWSGWTEAGLPLRPPERYRDGVSDRGPTKDLEGRAIGSSSNSQQPSNGPTSRESSPLGVGDVVRISPKALGRNGRPALRDQWGKVTVLDPDGVHAYVDYQNQVLTFEKSELGVRLEAE